MQDSENKRQVMEHLIKKLADKETHDEAMHKINLIIEDAVSQSRSKRFGSKNIKRQGKVKKT